ncbi:MAG: hypothetical protein J2O48_11800 [Solirubrobacterales bacterium]|nr:hypothetical protein [Solirubrobacterales bacterium]
MNDQTIIEIAVRRGRTLDQPDLADRATAQLAWEAWTPIEGLIELPRDAEELIDAASAELGHLPLGGQRRRAWSCAEAGAWSLAQPVPQLSDCFHWAGPTRPGSALSAGWAVAATPSRSERSQGILKLGRRYQQPRLRLISERARPRVGSSSFVRRLVYGAIRLVNLHHRP